MSCTKNNGLFNTDFDHTFDRQNSRCQGEINEVEELKQFVQEITQEGLDEQIDKRIDEKVKVLTNSIAAINDKIKELVQKDDSLQALIDNLTNTVIPGLEGDITTLRNNYDTLNTKVNNIQNLIDSGQIGGSVTVIKSPTEPTDKSTGIIWIKTT